MIRNNKYGINNMDFKVAIFDLDGTILNSMDLWEEIDIEFLGKRGLAVPKDYINAICARSFEEAAEYTIELFDLKENVEDIIYEWNQMAIYKYSHEVRLRPFAREYLENLSKCGVKLSVATGLTYELFEPALKNNDVFHLFDYVCSVDDIGKGKQFPDIYMHAAKNLNVKPEECIVFEDVLNAIQSAKKAGMKTCGVYDKYSDEDKDVIQSIADKYIYDFNEAPYPIG
ncbi:HAD family phosphatase [Clostridium sp. Marseille-Q2269]|uniref:HAD family hydrolase n=1 Tax=Clostridium sp. Marseille-Q2269 TaxID=2942205 RepID=UPI002072E2F0|nr:HAD family phosphatase [Clostridium sp. Marseille-Q2269]